MDDSITKISDTLCRIQNEGGHSNFVIFIADAEKNYYIQIVASKGDQRLLAEAVSNNFLGREHELNPSQINKLIKLGWSKHGQNQNFQREWNARDDRDRLEIAQMVRETFIDVYSWEPKHGIEIELILE